MLKVIDGKIQISNYAVIFGLMVSVSNYQIYGLDYMTIIAIISTIISFFTRFRILKSFQYMLPMALGIFLIFRDWQSYGGYLYIHVITFSIMDIYNKINKKIYLGTNIIISTYVIIMSFLEYENIYYALSIVAINIFMYQIINLRNYIKTEKETKKLKDDLQIKNCEVHILKKQTEKLSKIQNKNIKVFNEIIQRLRNIPYTEFPGDKK